MARLIELTGEGCIHFQGLFMGHLEEVQRGFARVKLGGDGGANLALVSLDDLEALERLDAFDRSTEHNLGDRCLGCGVVRFSSVRAVLNPSYAGYTPGCSLCGAWFA